MKLHILILAGEDRDDISLFIGRTWRGALQDYRTSFDVAEDQEYHQEFIDSVKDLKEDEQVYLDIGQVAIHNVYNI